MLSNKAFQLLQDCPFFQELSHNWNKSLPTVFHKMYIFCTNLSPDRIPCFLYNIFLKYLFFFLCYYPMNKF